MFCFLLGEASNKYMVKKHKLLHVRKNDFIPATCFIIGKMNETDLSRLNNLKVLLIPIPGYFTGVNASNMSCIGIALDAYASCIVSDNFNDFRSFLIFSNNSVVNVDVHVNVNVDDYLNSKFYDHDFQSKPESNSKNVKPQILFSVFSLMFYYFFETQS